MKNIWDMVNNFCAPVSNLITNTLTDMNGDDTAKWSHPQSMGSGFSSGMVKTQNQLEHTYDTSKK